MLRSLPKALLAFRRHISPFNSPSTASSNSPESRMEYTPQYYAYPPDGEKAPPPPMSPTQVQSSDGASQTSDVGRTELRQTLKERHVNMIGFSTVLGLGLFLSAGKAIYMAGPGAAVVAYLVAGTIMWSAMACIGEMTALFPVKGPIFEFSRRFIDESVGLAIGWITWYVNFKNNSVLVADLRLCFHGS